MWKNIKLSILSGILISIGGSVYMASTTAGISWLGAILFTGRLYAICIYGFNLYTGKVGYFAEKYNDGSYWGLVGITLIFNILTTFVLGVLIGKLFPAVRQAALKSYEAKLAAPYWKDLVSGIFCGMLMFLAVDTWKEGHKLGMFFYVPIFIIAGFDHSIANSFYNDAALSDATWTLNNLYLILIVILGNGIGGVIIPLLKKDRKPKDEDPSKYII